MSEILVTSGTAGDRNSSAAELINELRTTMLAVPEFDNFLEMYLFEQEPVGANAKTVQWTRMERLPVATSPSQLTEGQAADAIGITINKVTATVEEYGTALQISRLASMTARNPIVQEGVKKLGLHVKETRDRLLYAIGDASTNTFRVADRANDAAIAVGDVVTTEEIAQMRSALRRAGAPQWADGGYRYVVPTNQYSSLQTDPSLLAAKEFAFAEEIRRGFVGKFHNVNCFETNSNSFVTTASTTTGNSSAIRSGFIAGPGWAKVTDLQATEMHMQAPGQGTDYQKRRYEMAWTSVFKSVICNQSFGFRVRASSDDAVAV